MDVTFLKSLDSGAKLYLCPVAYRIGGMRGIAFGNTGKRFLELRIIARMGIDIELDISLTTDELLQFLPDLQDVHRSQLVTQIEALKAPRMPLSLHGGKTLAFTKPLVMGILNITPDSFSDGGKYLDPVHALSKARKMMAAGADIIDIGGESTRPGADPVWEGEEAERVIPVIEALQNDGIPISIDTRHASVMEKAVQAGAHIINDVTALSYDPESLRTATGLDVPVILMHSQGTPKTMQDNPSYQHTLLDVYDYLEERVRVAVESGISRDKLILDPGLGFGKRMVQDNLALINGLSLFHTLGLPILFGASRKSFIGAITGEDEAEKRLPGSLAADMRAVELGAQIVRVHDVAETKAVLKMVQAFHDAAVMDAISLMGEEL